MNVGETRYFKEGNGWFRYKVTSVHEFEDAVTLTNGASERICKKSECITVKEYEALRLEQERKDQEPRLRAVIDAFNAGHTTAFKVSEHLKIHHLAARGKLLAAHRLKFIQLPIGPDGFPDPNPKNESNPV